MATLPPSENIAGYFFGFGSYLPVTCPLRAMWHITPQMLCLLKQGTTLAPREDCLRVVGFIKYVIILDSEVHHKKGFSNFQ